MLRKKVLIIEGRYFLISIAILGVKYLHDILKLAFSLSIVSYQFNFRFNEISKWRRIILK